MKEGLTLEKPTEPERYKITDYEGWLEFAKRIEDRIEEADPKELDETKVMWRGMNPEEILDLICEKTDTIRIQSKKERPNTTLDWHKAISYPGRDFTCAVGFLPGEDWKVVPATEKLPKDLSEEALKYQRGNFIASGDLHPQDLRYLILRFPEGPGRPGEPVVYKINYKKFSEQKAA